MVGDFLNRRVAASCATGTRCNDIRSQRRSRWCDNACCDLRERNVSLFPFLCFSLPMQSRSLVSRAVSAGEHLCGPATLPPGGLLQAEGSFSWLLSPTDPRSSRNEASPGLEKKGLTVRHMAGGGHHLLSVNELDSNTSSSSFSSGGNPACDERTCHTRALSYGQVLYMTLRVPEDKSPPPSPKVQSAPSY